MSLIQIDASTYERSDGMRIEPAGLFTYRVIRRAGEVYTFWLTFRKQSEASNALCFMPLPPVWDNGAPMTVDDADDVAQFVTQTFAAKNITTSWVPMHAEEVQPEQVRSLLALFQCIRATPGGKWLDNHSENSSLTDAQRVELWDAAINQFEQANLLEQQNS